MLHYEIDMCSECRQGMLEFRTELKTGKIFVRCDECYNEYDTAENAKNDIGVTYEKYGKSRVATLEEIKTANVENYIEEAWNDDELYNATPPVTRVTVPSVSIMPANMPNAVNQ